MTTPPTYFSHRGWQDGNICGALLKACFSWASCNVCQCCIGWSSIYSRWPGLLEPRWWVPLPHRSKHGVWRGKMPASGAFYCSYKGIRNSRLITLFAFLSRLSAQIEWGKFWSIYHLLAPGQVIVGGHDGTNAGISKVELFPPSDACSIPDLPQPRFLHSLSLMSGGRLVVCGGRGGGDYFDSCLSWVAGNTSWTTIFTMRYVQWFFSNFFSPKLTVRWELGTRHGRLHLCRTPLSYLAAVTLLGTALQLQHISLQKFYQVFQRSVHTIHLCSDGKKFALSHSGKFACGIPDKDSIVMTGGQWRVSGGEAHSFVTRWAF